MANLQDESNGGISSGKRLREGKQPLNKSRNLPDMKDDIPN